MENEELNLDYYIEKYGTDKSRSGYSCTYEELFKPIRNEVRFVLEIGIGTLDSSIPSTFARNIRLFSHYKPGGSLRVWRDYFPFAEIFGVDIADDCMFEEERIKTFKFDSTDNDKCDENLSNIVFDVIIDDGNHDPEYQISTLRNLFNKLKNGGYYIIEDVGGYSPKIGKKKELLTDYFDEFNNIIEDSSIINKGNHIVIHKFIKTSEIISDIKLEEKNDDTDLNISPEIKNDDNLKKIDSLSLFKNEFRKLISGLSKEEKDVILECLTKPNIEILNNDLTVVTGLWNINRPGRDFNHYIENFKKFLEIPNKLFIYIQKEYEYLVWEKRTPENAYVKIMELSDIKELYNPFWDRTQKIRTNPDWYNLTGENGWLSGSPQAILEWYNPIVQSKMFLLNNATIWNPFNTEYFLWLDAGITNTVYEKYLTEQRALDNINQYLEQFLFLSYPYEARDEIHGFKFDAINRFAENKVEYVCRGGLFGGRKEIINQANSSYYVMLGRTLDSGYMGTEECIFTILSYIDSHIYRRYSLDGNGLIVKFIADLVNNNVNLEPIPENKLSLFKGLGGRTPKDTDVLKLKTNLYILTFNFPEQLEHTIKSMKKVPEWVTRPRVFVLDNSTIEQSKITNKKIAEENNFSYIDLGGNTGICGGRQAAAEHFNESDADYMFFFEDDMTINSSEFEGKFCRNGFRKYVPNLYNIIHKIMMREDFDFLKLSFTEVFFDNDKQCSWYNVPQTVRTRDWPDYDKLPISGLDPNVPLTNFKNIRTFDEVAYIDGEIYYANWPMIVSKEGNKKMFIETKWAHPYEQTWMSYMYQQTKEGKLKPAILLCSPIWHDRIKYYEPNERKES